MNWEKEIEELEKISLEEIEAKISEHEKKETESAMDAISEIHYILDLDISDKDKLKKIREVDRKVLKLSIEGVKYSIQKRNKELLTEDPETYAKMKKGVAELVNGIKEDEEGS